LRFCLEELGPTFIKLGQLLASRPDIIPQFYVEEFKKLQDQVPAVPFEKLIPLLEEQYAQGSENVFEWIEEKPIGSASIAQVHRAQLKTGEQVVLKIQKPGISKIIKEDIEILKWVADYIENSIPEFRTLNPRELVAEFSQAIETETQFIIEANYVRRFYENFKDNESIIIPKPFLEYSGDKIFVMEYISGMPFSEIKKMATDEQRESLMKKGLNAYFSMVFRDGLFHGDLHAGNIIVVDSEHLAFIDFGMVGRLSRRLQSGIANMFLALANEDYERLALEYIELSTKTIDVNPVQFASDLRRLLSPYFGLNLKNLNIGKLLVESSRIAYKHQVYLPSDLLIFFKSMVTIEGLGRSLKEDFDLLPFVYDFSNEIVKLKYDPATMASDIGAFSREVSSLLKVLPLEVRNYLRKLNQPNYSPSIELKNLDLLSQSLRESAQGLFSALIIASLIISGTIYASLTNAGSEKEIPFLSTVFFILAGVLFIRAVYLQKK
jgi:ubiquinone biosynthesis protein